jgi:hypothetical protein
MPAPQTATELLAAAASAYTNLNDTGWGEVYIIFLDPDRATQAIIYSSPMEDETEDAELCAEEVREALDAGWRPVCLQILPYADATIVPLQNSLTLDDKAVIWELKAGGRNKQAT